MRPTKEKKARRMPMIDPRTRAEAQIAKLFPFQQWRFVRPEVGIRMQKGGRQ